MQFLQFKITEYLTILKDRRKCKDPTIWISSFGHPPMLMDEEKIEYVTPFKDL